MTFSRFLNLATNRTQQKESPGILLLHSSKSNIKINTNHVFFTLFLYLTVYLRKILNYLPFPSDIESNDRMEDFENFCLNFFSTQGVIKKTLASC